MNLRVLVATLLALAALLAGGVWWAGGSGSGQTLVLPLGGDPKNAAVPAEITALVVPPSAKTSRTAPVLKRTPSVTEDEVETAGRKRPIATIPERPGPTTDITGSVRTLAGIGLEQILVSAAPTERSAAPKVWARTDHEGSFRFVVPEDSRLAYDVRVVGSTEDEAIGNLIRTLKRDGELVYEAVPPGSSEIRFEVPTPGTANLIVLDALSGGEVPFVTLDWATAQELEDGTGELRPYGSGLRLLNRGADGRIHVGLPAGRLHVRVSAAGYVSETVEIDVIPHTRSHPTVVELDRKPVVLMTLVARLVADADRRRAARDLPFALARTRLPRTIYLLTPEEHAEHAGAYHDFYIAQRARLESEGRTFEVEPDGRYLATPGEGTYHITDFPNLATFEPSELTVTGSGLELTVEVTPGSAFDWDEL